MRAFPARFLLAVLLSSLSVSVSALSWVEDIDTALTESEKTGKPVLLLVTGGIWCDPCNWLEENTLTQASIASLVRAGFVPVRILDTDPGWDSWGVERLPTLIVLDSRGEEITRLTGPVTAQVLREALAPHAASLESPQRERTVSALEALRGAVFRIGTVGTLWNDGGANWYSQDAGLPPRLEEYDRDDTFLYLQDRGSATLLGVPLERTPRGGSAVLWRWSLEQQDWEEATSLERLD